MNFEEEEENVDYLSKEGKIKTFGQQKQRESEISQNGQSTSDTSSQEDNGEKKNPKNNLLFNNVVNSLDKEPKEKLHQATLVQSNEVTAQQQNSKQNLSQEDNLEKQLSDGLAQLQIKDTTELQIEIQDKQDVIQKLEKKGQSIKVIERKKSLEKLLNLQSVFFELKKLQSSSSTSQPCQKELLELELQAGLAELQIKDVTQLKVEIQDKIDSIQNLQKKGQTNKVIERKKSLEKLEHLQTLFFQLEQVKPSSSSSENQTKKELLELELKEGLSELQLKDVAELNIEIQEKIDLIQNLQKKGQTNKIIERKKSLEKLQHLQSVSIELDNLQPLQPKPQTKQEQLENQLKCGLDEFQIQEAKLLQSEINERIELIHNYEKRGQLNKASDRRKSLEKLENLQSIFQQLTQLGQTNTYGHQSQQEELEIELRNCLRDLEIKDASLLLEEIKETKNLIENLEKKGQTNKVQKEKENLEKLENAQSIFIKLTNLKNSREVRNSVQTDEQSQKSNQTESKDQENTNTCTVSSNIDLKVLQKILSKIPECSEKCLLKLIQSGLQLKSTSQSIDTSNNQVTDRTDILSKQFQFLKDRLKIENMISQDVKQLLQKIEINIQQEKMELVIQESERLLKYLRPLNIQEMKRLIKKANEAAEIIKGQDILLFLGGTGAGKSTTIHFLSGSRMIEIETQVNAGTFLKYIGPDPKSIKNKALQKIKIGHQAESETRYITPVLVNFKEVGMTKEGSIILCDAPGFGDTAGPEVDIANGIGIVEAIKRCQSVRPVILVSSKSIGDKGEGIKKLAHILVGFVNNITDRLSSFSYLFTKYSPEDDIRAMLINIKNSVDKNQEECSDSSFVSLFEDMIEKTEDGVKRIEPLKDKPSKIINSLIKTAPILNPEGAFQFSITESSKGIIQEQIRMHQSSIISATKRSEYKLIEYKLDEMKFLIENLNQDFIRQAYSESVKFIIEGLNETYNNTITSFKKCIENDNKLTLEDLKEFKLLISQLQEADNLRKTHLGTNVVQTSSLIQKLQETVETISKEFNQQINDNNSSFINNLDNIKLIAEEFPEIKPKHMALCQVIETKISNLVLSCQQILIENDFSKLSVVLSQIKSYSINFKDHLNKEQIISQYKKGGESLLSHLNQICSKVQYIFKKRPLDEGDIDQLKTALSLIESAFETRELKEHINLQEVKKLKDNLSQKIVNYFENINNKIEESFKNEPESAFKDIEKWVQQMNLIRKIEGFDSKTSEMYHQTIQGIQGQMQQMRRDAEQLLSNLHHQKENINFSKIHRCLRGLKNAQWMNNVESGAYDDIMNNITEDLVKHALRLHEILNEIDLDLNHPDNLQEGLNVVSQLDAMRSFEQTISELTRYRESGIDKFKETIQKTLDFIQESFNLQNKEVYKQKLNIKLLESIKQEYEEYCSEKLFLREKGFQTLESLNEEISNKKKEQNLINKVENSQKNSEQFLQKLNENPKSASLDANCSSISEIQQNIEPHQNEIEQAEKIQKEIEKLQQIHDEYHQILNKNIPSQQGEDYLMKKKGYTKIQALDQEILTLNNVIQNSNSKDQEYAFPKLDGSLAERSYLFLEACKKIRWVKEVALNQFDKLSNFLKKYGDFLQQEIQINFQKIKEQKELNSSSQRFASFLQGINELERYSNIFEITQGKSTIQYWRALLTSYFIELSDDMSQISIDKQELRNKINIVKALGNIDFLLGDNKYFNLYRQYQNSMTNEFKEVYKHILELIEKNDFKQVSVELLSIDDNPINEKASGQIRHNINAQVMELIELAKTDAIMLTNNLDTTQIKSIIMNLNKIEIAKKYLGKSNSSTNGYFEDQTFTQIEKEQQEIKNIISNKISNYLQIIEALIAGSDFYDAEERKEHISQVYYLLGRFGEDTELTKKLESLQEKLEGIVQQILEKYEKMEFQDYISNPPKQILDKLQKVSSRSLKYSEFYNKLVEKIVGKVRLTLQKIKESNPNDRNEHIQSVEAAFCSIPDELRSQLKIDLDNCKKLINQKEEGYKEDFDRAVNSGDLVVLSKFMEKCKSDQMHSFQNQLQKEIIKQVQDFKEKIKASLEENSIKHALNLAKKVNEYQSNFGKTITEIDYTMKEVQSMTINKENKLISFLKSIQSIENNEEYETEYNHFFQFVEFKSENDQAKVLLGEDFDSKVEQVYQKLSDYFLESQQKCNQSLQNYNIVALNDSLKIIKKWNKLIKKIKSHSETFRLGDQPIKPLAEIVGKCQHYEENILQIGIVLKSLKSDILSFEFISGFSDQRKEFYCELDKKLKALNAAQTTNDNLQDTNFDLKSYEKECIPHIWTQVEIAQKNSIEILERNDQLSKKDFDTFNLQYDNLVSLEQNVKIADIQPKKNIEVIQQKLNEKVNQLQQKMMSSDVNNAVENLIGMKVLSDNIPSFKNEIDQNIDESLKEFMSKHKSDGGYTLGKLVTLLESEEKGVGRTIISEHKCFKGQSISIFNSQTQKHGIDYILDKIEGDQLDKKKLKTMFETVRSTYDTIVKKYIIKLEKKNQSQDQIIEELKSEIKLIPSGIKPKKDGKINWDGAVRDKIPQLIAHIFALWTLKNMEYYNEMNESGDRSNFMLQPHAGQIISILRLLGIGYMEKNSSKDQLQNNFIQIGTGEGKSVTLAVASSIFALFGADVSCACYSEYLSRRDYNDFKSIYEDLGIIQYIKYGPFNKICEDIINERGDIRELVINFVVNGAQKDIKKNKVSSRPRILLVDEVDVFFHKDFYGNIYNPLARLRDPSIKQLTDYVWEKREENISFKNFKLAPAFVNCINVFKGWEFLIEEALKDMISDSKNFYHEYVIMNDKIAYKEQDGISYDVTYGYKTLFAYYYQNQEGRISRSSLEENIFIGVRCGSFSYAQIPCKFEFIVGVTGTLKTLSEPEKNILEKEYQVTKKTFIPSVFGENKRVFAKQDDIYVENKENYFKRLRETIDKKIKRDKFNRAVLVFFETKQKLLDFYYSEELAPIKENVQIIIEEVSTSIKEKNFRIKRATTSSQITLLTKPFGRGTDFVCRDQQVLSNGGVHVTQVFFSRELSEEIQIQGRCGRQGEDGSYNMVLLDQDLERILGTDFRNDIDRMRSTNTFYSGLDKARAEVANFEFQNNKQFIDKINEEHKLGEQFVNNIHENGVEFVRKFLGSHNKGTDDQNGKSRILCLVDATSSMGALLNQAKNTVSIMFERAIQIMKEKNLPEDSFQLQFAVYRDYDCMIEGLLLSSPWESKPDNLRQFLEKVEPLGGGDYEEAIEIGLQHANCENEIQEISQIILIGDAPAKTKDQILNYRYNYGGEVYWSNSKFKQQTFYQDEVEKLKKNNIPINCFYLHKGAKDNFLEMANNTNGRCENLNMNSSKSSQILTNIVTEQILQSVGNAAGLGNELVDEYKRLFSKSYV